MTIPNTDHVEFLRETVVDVDAAVVGIGRDSWKGLPGEEATEERAAAMMKEHRFDVLPIREIDGAEVKRYFRTCNWNDYSSVCQRNITHKDVIPSQTGIRDVIKGFAVDKRHFYFLARERRINGLISIVNLNCRQVKVFLFSLLSELEVSLANLIDEDDSVSDDQLQERLFGEGVKGKHVVLKNNYEAALVKGVDVRFVDYLYLSDLINVIAHWRLYEKLGFDSPKSFKKYFNSLVELRDQVAHPARSIVTDETSVDNLWGKIDHIEETLFKLRVT